MSLAGAIWGRGEGAVGHASIHNDVTTMYESRRANCPNARVPGNPPLVLLLAVIDSPAQLTVIGALMPLH